jgi:hypothetical protein
VKNEGINGLIQTLATYLKEFDRLVTVSRHPKLERIFQCLRTSTQMSIRMSFMNEHQARQTVESMAQRLSGRKPWWRLRINTVLPDITLYREKVTVSFDSDVYPRLLVNNYRPHVVAIAKARVSGVASRSYRLWHRLPVNTT